MPGLERGAPGPKRGVPGGEFRGVFCADARGVEGTVNL